MKRIRIPILLLLLACCAPAPAEAQHASRQKIWATGEELKALHLNAEFDAIVNAINAMATGISTVKLAATTATLGTATVTTLGATNTTTGTLHATGRSRLQSAVDVNGAMRLDSTLGVTGAVELLSTLAVTGIGRFSNEVGITGTLNAYGAAKIVGALSAQSAAITGAITGASATMTGAVQGATLIGTTSITEEGTLLSAKYLGISALAADSAKLAGNTYQTYQNSKATIEALLTGTITSHNHDGTAGSFTTLAASGAAQLNGGLTMDTDKFTVADGTGDTVVGGTLRATGNLTLGANAILDWADGNYIGMPYLDGSDYKLGMSFVSSTRTINFDAFSPAAEAEFQFRLGTVASPTVAATINSSGNLTLGATDFASTTSKLYVDSGTGVQPLTIRTVGDPAIKVISTETYDSSPRADFTLNGRYDGTNYVDFARMVMLKNNASFGDRGGLLLLQTNVASTGLLATAFIVNDSQNVSLSSTDQALGRYVAGAVRLHADGLIRSGGKIAGTADATNSGFASAVYAYANGASLPVPPSGYVNEVHWTDSASNVKKIYIASSGTTSEVWTSEGALRRVYSSAASGSNNAYYNTHATPITVNYDAYYAKNSAGTQTKYFGIDKFVVWPTAGNESGGIGFDVMCNGSVLAGFSVSGHASGSLEHKFPSHMTTASAANAFLDSSTGLLSRSTSSRRYKENIAPLPFAWSSFDRLRPVTFTPKGKADRHVGFISEEVAEVYPEVVEWKDGVPEGLAYGHMTAINTAAIQRVRNSQKMIALMMAMLVLVTIALVEARLWRASRLACDEAIERFKA